MPWYQHWFADDLYMELYAHRDAAEARTAVDLFTALSGRLPGDGPVLDLACGTGRHAFELAKRGFRVVAADLSPTLLEVAARKTQKFGDRLALLRADMRRLPLRPATMAAVLQLFTAFGYFSSDEENAAVISGVSTLLLPGGYYLLDYLNAEHVRDTLQERSEQRIGDALVVQERSLTPTRVEKHILIRRNGDSRRFTESVRLFELSDFRDMFQAAGLRIVHVLGDYDGSPFEAGSPRCIVLGTRRT